MRIVLLLFLSLLLCSCSTPQEKNLEFTGNITQDIFFLLPAGAVTVDVLDSTVTSPRRLELSRKWMKAMQENPEFLLKYSKERDPFKDSLTYHPEFGLTEDEFREFKAFLEDNSDITYLSSRSEPVTIIRTQSFIALQFEGSLSPLNGMMLNLKDTTMQVLGHRCTFKKSVEVKDAKNALRTTWKGYTWEYNEGEIPNPLKPEDWSTIDAKAYVVTLGHLDNSNETYIEITGQEIHPGQKPLEIAVRFKFRK